MKAMTLLEMIVVMGIFTISTYIMLPYTVKLVNQTRTDSEAKNITYALFRQQQDSYAGLGNSGYGIAFTTTGYTVFTGDSLATAAYKDTYTLNESVRITSIQLGASNEVAYPKNSFRPNHTGYILLSDSISVYRVDITQEGLISFYEVQ